MLHYGSPPQTYKKNLKICGNSLEIQDTIYVPHFFNPISMGRWMENFVLAPIAECGRYICDRFFNDEENDCDSKAKGKKPGTTGGLLG